MTDTNLHLLQALATDVQKNAFCEEDTEIQFGYGKLTIAKNFQGVFERSFKIPDNRRP